MSRKWHCADVEMQRKRRVGIDADRVRYRRTGAGATFLIALLLGSRALATEPLVHEAIIHAPVQEVWRLFTTAEGMQSWMAARADIDLSIGGLMRTRYAGDGPLGDDKTIVNRILSFEPERMLSIQVARPPADFRWKSAVKNMWTVMYFRPIEPGTTSVRIVGLGFDGSEESRQMRAFFADGNAWTLEQLRKRFLP